MHAPLRLTFGAMIVVAVATMFVGDTRASQNARRHLPEI
jgi:hypothetical protein